MNAYTDRDWRYFIYLNELLDPKHIQDLITTEKKREASCINYKSEFLSKREEMYQILLNELEEGNVTSVTTFDRNFP